ncbi:hypothetical protein ACTNDP_22175 [Paenibacillus barengoltzii]|uniref:hypothetical protein n=1 Tax=Paenibacillus barengoltzii TaxID=343517 RepID=UPI003F8AEC72
MADVVPSTTEADSTAPVTERDVAGIEGADVYNQTEVTVTFNAEDEGGSGLDRTEYRVKINGLPA